MTPQLRPDTFFTLDDLQAVYEHRNIPTKRTIIATINGAKF